MTIETTDLTDLNPETNTNHHSVTRTRNITTEAEKDRTRHGTDKTDTQTTSHDQTAERIIDKNHQCIEDFPDQHQGKTDHIKKTTQGIAGNQHPHLLDKA